MNRAERTAIRMERLTQQRMARERLLTARSTPRPTLAAPQQKQQQQQQQQAKRSGCGCSRG